MWARTRIQRLPLVVPPVVKLRVEGPALLLPEAPPGGRTFLQGGDSAVRPFYSATAYM